MKLYNDERDRLARFSKLALDAGVAERQIQIAEQQGTILAQTLLAVFGDTTLGLTPDQQQLARTLAGRHLRIVAARMPSDDEELFGPGPQE